MSFSLITPAQPPSGEIILPKKKPINPALAYLATLHSETGRISMRSKLNVVARMAGYPDLETCDWTALKPEHVLEIMNRLEREGRKGNTVNCYLAALKGVVKAAWLAELVSHDTMMRVNAVKQRRFRRLPAGRALSMSESHALLADCDKRDDAIGRRDKVILGLMLGCGLRRGEVPELMFGNYDPEEGSLRVIGKGDKERLVFLPPQVEDWLRLWIVTDRGEEEGFLFGRIYKNGRLDLLRPLDARSIGDILRSHLANVGREGGRTLPTAHDLRRTFATRLLEENVDITTVQGMMGHSSVTTTSNYDRRGNARHKESSRKVRI